jgi:hypothetical protein
MCAGGAAGCTAVLQVGDTMSTFQEAVREKMETYVIYKRCT